MLKTILQVLVWTLLTTSVFAEVLGATTNDTVVVRTAPSQAAAVTDTLPAGTPLTIDLCFDEGAYCAVRSGTVVGFVAGQLLTLSDGSTALEHEQAIWKRMADSPSPFRLIDPTSDIAAWGDSLTAGAGSEKGGTYPTQARKYLPGRLIENLGIGGQTSTQIAARMGAVDTKLTVEDGAIPASDPVDVVDRSVTPITNQGPSALPGTLCGVHGTLRGSTGDQGKSYRYQFARDLGGAVVSCPALSKFTFDADVSMRPRIAWLWLGRNSADPGHTVDGDIAAAVAHLGHDRYLVGAILPGAGDSSSVLEMLRTTNLALKATYGERFVDLVAALQKATSGSAEDRADVSAGLVPRSLRYDAVHLNNAGYAVVAKAFAEATTRLGY